MVGLIQKREVWKETYKLGVATIATRGLETKEERKLHFKKESGVNMCLKNKHCEN